MKVETIGKVLVKIANSIINNALLITIVVLIAFAGYALWDSRQLHQAAESSVYAIYKPTVEDEGQSFKELQAINDEVFAWLTVYGTSIDYPVTQGEDNMKYVNMNAEGEYSLSGAIFLDYANSRDFSDFNSIVYGHHMAKRTMFGELSEFSDRAKFDAHRYGNLYFNEKDHGIEFFAYLHADAYDNSVFAANVTDEYRQTYLDGLLSRAIHTRDIGVTIEDRIILLSTCSSSSTNGRDILVGRIIDRTYDGNETIDEVEEYISNGVHCSVIRIPPWVIMLVLVALPLPIVRAVEIYRKKKEGRKHDEYIQD